MITTTNGTAHKTLHIVIVGAGLGGLACAIQCRREGLDVLVLEKEAELSELGAGIQVPPNAIAVMEHLNLREKLLKAGMVVKQSGFLLRWEDGAVIGERPGSDWATANFGHDWCVIHRADYQRVLADEVKRLGIQIRFGTEVLEVKCHDEMPEIMLATGEVLVADVVIGADGLRSGVRTSVLGRVKEPEQSGDLAYRVTIPREALEQESDDFIQGVLHRSIDAIWWGPERHVVLYAVRNRTLINIVLVLPDDLPIEVSKQPGDLEEMRKLFEHWDPRLQLLLTKVDKALKWKIWTMEELDTWTKGSVALLGDACHPIVPYAAQGAAIAVEDGAVLGRLLGLYSRSAFGRIEGNSGKSRSLPSLLQLYQRIRKERTALIRSYADDGGAIYSMPDGPEQIERDRRLKEHDWWDENKRFPWAYADLKKSKGMLGFDAVGNANEAWERWQLYD